MLARHHRCSLSTDNWFWRGFNPLLIRVSTKQDFSNINWQGLNKLTKGRKKKRKEEAGEIQIARPFSICEMWPKCFQRQTEAAWKPKQACEGVWHLMIEWEGGLSFTRCGMQVQIVLLHCDWWRDVHHPPRVRDEEREGVRVYRPQQIDVRLRTISQNRMKRSQEIVNSDCIIHAMTQCRHHQALLLWLMFSCLLTLPF